MFASVEQRPLLVCHVNKFQASPNKLSRNFIATILVPYILFTIIYLHVDYFYKMLM